MLIGLGVVAIAVILHVFAAYTAEARKSHDRNRSTHTGASIDHSEKWVRRAQTGGWLLSIVGVVRIADLYWDAEPWLSAGLAVVALGLVNGLPSLAVAVLYGNRRHV